MTIGFNHEDCSGIVHTQCVCKWTNTVIYTVLVTQPKYWLTVDSFDMLSQPSSSGRLCTLLPTHLLLLRQVWLYEPLHCADNIVKVSALSLFKCAYYTIDRHSVKWISAQETHSWPIFIPTRVNPGSMSTSFVVLAIIATQINSLTMTSLYISAAIQSVHNTRSESFIECITMWAESC